ncbi:MAG: HAD-IA family hydrolase [Nitrososphaerota archaeon]
MADMRISRPSIIVFDLDGTLIEFRLELSEAKRRIVETMLSMGMPAEAVSVKDSIQTLIQKSELHLGVDRSKALKAHVLEIMREYEIRAASRSTPRRGVNELLYELKKNGYRLAVATNTHREAAILSLSRAGIIGHLEVVLTRDDVDNLKPRGDVLLKVLELMNTDPADALYVGDSVHDLQAARETGVRFIGIEGGEHSRDDLMAAGCETVLSNPMELLNFLGLPYQGG